MYEKDDILSLCFIVYTLCSIMSMGLEGIFLDHINSIVAENLRQLREQKKLSLDAVAKLSGVSKSMLGQIERGDVNPTISTVWKISNGLKISFSELLSRAEEECEVVDIKDVQPLLEDEGRYRNYPVFPFEVNRRFEMLYIEVDPQSHLEAEAHPEGTQEFITIFSGELVINVNDEVLTVKECGSIRFRADKAHRYQNVGMEVCRLSMVIYYPE